VQTPLDVFCRHFTVPPVLDAPMPGDAALEAFLRDRYLHSRLAGSGEAREWPDYVAVVVANYRQTLVNEGFALISQYESASGRMVLFDRRLVVLNPDAPPAQIQRQAPHITHLF
jgi:hypothetical protein